MDGVFVYVVDTSTLWTLFGRLSNEEARPLFEASDVSLEEATDLAGSLVLTASGNKATAAHPQGQHALEACMRYLGQTQAYAKLKETAPQSVEGHWLVLVYRFASGALTLRPAFLHLNGGARMSTQELLQLLLQVLRHDMDSSSGLLRQRTRTEGDLQLAPALAARWRPH